ncbi:MAG: DUF3147 family protein [Candidatus Micrarchaeia archaeon]|jgi:uncharacterized membrane protein (GlpM family)
MDELILKIILSFIAGGVWITFSVVLAEKLGNKIGAILIALPTTMLVSLFFIGWTASPGFAAETARIIPFAMIANSIYIFSLILFLKKYGNLAFLISFAIWITAALLLKMVNGVDMIIGVLADIAITALLFYIAEKRMNIRSADGARGEYPIAELFARAAFAGGVVALSVIVANFAGPVWGGIFATFPAATLSSMYILNKKRGPDFAMATCKAMLPATMTIIVYVIAVHAAYPDYGLIIGTVISYAASILSGVLIYIFTKRMK